MKLLSDLVTSRNPFSFLLTDDTLPFAPPSTTAPSDYFDRGNYGRHRFSFLCSWDPAGALDSVLSEWGMVVKTHEWLLLSIMTTQAQWASSGYLAGLNC